MICNRESKSKKCFVRIHCELALSLSGLIYSGWLAAVVTGNCLFSMDFDCLIVDCNKEARALHIQGHTPVSVQSADCASLAHNKVHTCVMPRLGTSLVHNQSPSVCLCCSCLLLTAGETLRVVPLSNLGWWCHAKLLLNACPPTVALSCM